MDESGPDDERDAPTDEGEPSGTDGSGTDGGAGAPDGSIGLVEAKDRALDTAGDLLSHPVEDVIEVGQAGDGWRVVIEVVEREAVPDTQDILGRYEFVVSADGRIDGYELVDRYRRGGMKGGL